MLWLTWMSASFVLCVGLTSLYFSAAEYCSLLPLGVNSLLPCGVFHSVKHRAHLEMELGGSSHLLEVSGAHFGLSLMVVSVDAREGKAFPFCVAVADPVVHAAQHHVR